MGASLSESANGIFKAIQKILGSKIMDKIKEINSLIETAERLELFDESALKALKSESEMVIRSIFDTEHPYYDRLQGLNFHSRIATEYDDIWQEVPAGDEEEEWNSGKENLLILLKTILKELSLKKQATEGKKMKVKVNSRQIKYLLFTAMMMG